MGQPQSVSMTTGVGGEGMGRTLQSHRFEQKHEVSVLDWSHHLLRFKSQVKVNFSLEWIRIKLFMLHPLPGILSHSWHPCSFSLKVYSALAVICYA